MTQFTRTETVGIPVSISADKCVDNRGYADLNLDRCQEVFLFDWDDANIDHIARHGLEPKDVEEALLDSESVPMPAYNYGSEKRRGLVGATNGGRILSVVYTERSGKTRPITAREASKSEKRRYKR